MFPQGIIKRRGFYGIDKSNAIKEAKLNYLFITSEINRIKSKSCANMISSFLLKQLQFYTLKEVN